MAASQLVIRGVQVQTPDGPVQQADVDAFYAKLEMSIGRDMRFQPHRCRFDRYQRVRMPERCWRNMHRMQ